MPAVPGSLLDGKEGVDGSSPSEGLKKIPANEAVPRVFGYHELLHVLTLAATACLYASIAFFVLPLD